jgi:hypothetical protein
VSCRRLQCPKDRFTDCITRRLSHHLPNTPASSITITSPSPKNRHSATTTPSASNRHETTMPSRPKTTSKDNRQRRRHNSSASSSTAGSAPSPRAASQSASGTLSLTKPHCPHPSCLTPQGHPLRFFSRRADVTRHDRSMHQKCYIDCPRPRCARKGGDNGFTRKDHLTEHLRQYHGLTLPRRGGGS